MVHVETTLEILCSQAVPSRAGQWRTRRESELKCFGLHVIIEVEGVVDASVSQGKRLLPTLTRSFRAKAAWEYLHVHVVNVNVARH